MEPNRLGDITAFVATVKTGSFTAAADMLGLTRSAVGKSVARLETRLHTRLLHRTTRKLSLTDEGKAVYERWRQVLDDLDELSDIAELNGLWNCHQLIGDRFPQWSLTVSGNWRITFEFENSNVFLVNYEDYH